MENDLFEKLKLSSEKISDSYENYKFKDALSETMNSVRDANKYFNDSAPWKEIKDNRTRCETIINTCLQLIHSFAILFEPVLPFTSAKILHILNKGREDFVWKRSADACLKDDHTLNKHEILFTKIEDIELEDL
jgi:methionyl-tRNA synthetase